MPTPRASCLNEWHTHTHTVAHTNVLQVFVTIARDVMKRLQQEQEQQQQQVPQQQPPLQLTSSLDKTKKKKNGCC